MWCVAQSLSPWSKHCSVTSTKQPCCSFTCFRCVGFHLYLCMCERVCLGAQWRVGVNGGDCVGNGTVKSFKKTLQDLPVFQHLATSTLLHIFPLSPFLSPYTASHFPSSPPGLYKSGRCIVYEQPVFSACTKGEKYNWGYATRHLFIGRIRRRETGRGGGCVRVCWGGRGRTVLISGCFSL